MSRQWLAAGAGSSAMVLMLVNTKRCRIPGKHVPDKSRPTTSERLGSVPLIRLTWQDIELLYAAMCASGRGPARTRPCATALTRALVLARKRGLIDTNPAKDAVRPKSIRTKPFSPAADDVRDLLETVALRWTDVDRANGELHAAAAIADGAPGVGVLRKSTKRPDWRDVPLTTRALEAVDRR